MSEITLQIPEKLIPVFTPERGALLYRIAKGGRGSAKTRTFALLSALRVIEMRNEGLSGVFLCGREFMNTLQDSSLEEIKQVIQEDEYLNSQFDCGKEYIRTKCGAIKYLFVGLRHNLDSLKSKARVLCSWIDEAETVSETAWMKLTATVLREPKSEIWITYNPESPESATHRRFVEQFDPTIMVSADCNWSDNPWFPIGLEKQRQSDMKNRPDIYDHIWEGEFLTRTEAQIFAGKFRTEEFTPNPAWDGPYCGLDFGFAKDPNAAVLIWKTGNTLYIEKEYYGVGVEIDKLGGELLKAIPEFATHVVRADSARPDLISYLKRQTGQTGGTGQIPRIEGAVKGKGSVEDGVEFIKSHNVIIHPRCTNTLKEFKLYSYKVDRLSGDILPVIVDDWNHIIDSARYALEPVMRSKGFNWDTLL